MTSPYRASAGISGDVPDESTAVGEDIILEAQQAAIMMYQQELDEEHQEDEH